MPFSVINWAASLHFAIHSSFVALSARALATRTTLTITTNASTTAFLIAFLIASPFPTGSLRMLFPSASLHNRNPVVPSDHLLTIDR